MNSNNNENIYYKLKDELINSLESEEFYEVFNRSIKSGTNNFSLYQKFMNNIIDVKWVTAIEECIIPIDNIIRNPMRFIKQEEEIVPIEQAKKISQESIRHLAQHTNMISKVDYDGSVTPNKILNIHKEETFATYENRFIYTLLKHVQYFIDKRLRALNDSKVQAENRISVESEFKIGKEKIKYEFSLSSTEQTEKNKKNFKLDEDTSQMDLLQRVERLRMILYDFQNSQLIKNLDGCLLVRPPIMRTNVILKNPNFKKAMELWTFIESYNDAGLSVQIIENEELPSNEYMNELFAVSLVNYHLFNHHIKPDKELITKVPASKEFRPNLVRKTVEQYVEEFDMDIDEIEKIFIDQIKKATKKQKENEVKVKKAIDRALEKEKANKKKAEEQERIRKEKERALAKKQKEQEKLLAKKAKEEEKLRIKNSIFNNALIIEKMFTDQDYGFNIEFNKSRTSYKVYYKKEQALYGQYNDVEGKITFRGNEDFYDYIDAKYPELLSKFTIGKQQDWYILIDNGNIKEIDIKALVNHNIKYIKYLEEAEEKRIHALRERERPKVLSKAVIDKDLKEIEDYILNTYPDVLIIDEGVNQFRVLRNKKVLLLAKGSATDYTVTFQRKQAAMTKLVKKYPKLIVKAKTPKGHQWYSLISNGEIKMKEILSIIDYSYNYSIEEENKVSTTTKKKKTKNQRQIKL